MRGVLGGILRKQKEGRSASEVSQRVLAEHRDQIERYESFCDDLGSPPATVGIAWLLKQPGVTAPIIGPRTLEQLESSIRALQVSLDDAALEWLDVIFPPVGPAPEAYAW
jgi:aryl-alcohol dehydrogenase-like predicted oxidoreductase